jgi:hypothetical protein
MTDTQGTPEWSLSDIPGSVLLRAQEDPDFAVRLLHRDSREEALIEPGLDLSDEQLRKLSPILDEIARMSFREAIEMLRDYRVTMK